MPEFLIYAPYFHTPVFPVLCGILSYQNEQMHSWLTFTWENVVYSQL